MPNTDFSQTVMEQFEDISTMVTQHESMANRWGESIPRFYLRDIQDNEVIVVDRKNSYQMFGFPFTMKGDKAEIDFACGGSRKKTRYENYEDGESVTTPEGAFDFGKHIEELENAAYAKIQEAENKVTVAEEAKSTAETNYQQIKSDYDAMKPKFDEFVKAEEARLEAEVDAKKDAEFARYEVALADSTEFAALKDKKADMSLNEIVSECAILYARKNLGNYSKSNGQSMVAGVMDDNDDAGEGFVTTKYGNIPVRR